MSVPEQECETPFLAPNQVHYDMVSVVDPYSGRFSSVVVGLSSELNDGPPTDPNKPCQRLRLMQKARSRKKFNEKALCGNCSRVSSVVKK